MLKKIIGMILLSGLLTGCSTTPYVPEGSSKAYTVTRYAGLDGLSDQTVPKEERQHLTDSNLYKGAWTANAYYNPAKGFSSGFGLGLGLAQMLFSPKSDAENVHVLVWYPKDKAETAEQAKEQVYDALKLAQEQAVKVLYEGVSEHKEVNAKHFATVRFIHDTNHNCTKIEKGPDSSTCWTIAFFSTKPEVKPAPFSNMESYFFPLVPNGTMRLSYNRKTKPIELVGDKWLEFLTVFSQAMPEWAYLYVGPKNVTFEGEVIKYPFVLHKGETLLFIKDE